MAIIKIPNGSGGWIKFPTIKGDKGEDGTMSFEDLTPEQKLSLKGDKGIQGEQGEKGERGDTGLPGSDASVTKSNVISALGYTPPEQDTITTINGKTGVISKADIVALGIPAQDTVYTHPAGTNPHGTTKSDVGLGNVTNDKQMPISNGVLENYREKLATVSAANGSIDLSLGNVFQHSPSGNITYSISNAVSGQAHSFTLLITQTATARTITFPASVKWQGGEIPDLTTASKTYVLTFVTVNGGTTWLGMFGGEF